MVELYEKELKQVNYDAKAIKPPQRRFIMTELLWKTDKKKIEIWKKIKRKINNVQKTINYG